MPDPQPFPDPQLDAQLDAARSGQVDSLRAQQAAALAGSQPVWEYLLVPVPEDAYAVEAQSTRPYRLGPGWVPLGVHVENGAAYLTVAREVAP